MFGSEDLMNGELKIIGQEQPQPNVRFNPDIYLHFLRKMWNISTGKTGFELRIAPVPFHK